MPSNKLLCDSDLHGGIMKNYLIFLFFILFISNAIADESSFIKHGVAISYDKENIAYSVYGSGNRALIFVHGWSCDSRYWVNQLHSFAKKYKVITVDLGGHGNSSSTRSDFTINSFAKDIQAVVEQEAIDNIILIGHSMGGPVVVSTARLLPNKVKGVIGVDTLHDISVKISQSDLNAAIKPFEESYNKTMSAFVASLFIQNTDKKLKRWISLDMVSATKPVAISAYSNFMAQYKTGESSSVFENMNIPIITINAKLWPTNVKGNESKIKYYQSIFIEGTGHFPMLEKPILFNSLLEKAIQGI
jgi:pimeloyl-ACP methyl ester carboxylesterase